MQGMTLKQAAKARFFSLVDAIEDATKYATMEDVTVYILRRGLEYQTSQNEKKGWKTISKVVPESKRVS